ncbi:MAG: hypothetical protein ACF8XB_06685 [Planctomycetota bacterium JB042]
MNHRQWAASALAAFLLTPSSLAQDSLSLNGCLPGDGLDLWADSTGFFGSEQVNDYVVDVATLTTSWGTDFAIAPIAKTSKGNFNFFNHLMGAQAMSRDVLGAHSFAADQYMVWSGPGFGVHNDPGTNSPGAMIDTSNARGAQFAAAFREFGNTDFNASSVGAVTTIVNVDPTDTGRLFVRRVQSLTNACDNVSDLATFGMGGVDAEGTTAIRADGFGIVAGGCGASILTGNNIYLVDAANRNPAVRNVSDDAGSLLDAAATNWIVQQSGTTHTCPTLIPSSVTGGAPIYIGADFNNGYVRGTTNTNVTSDQTHLAVGTAGTRGNLGYTTDNFALLNSSGGLGAMIADTGGSTDSINIFGVNTSGAVTGKMLQTLPATITDNATGFSNLPGANEIDHYHSQVPFQGGNGNIALRVDALGNLLAATAVDHPNDSGAQHDGQYLAVCRVDPFGTASWTMAGYNNPNTGSGKPILNAPSAFGGTPIGQMVPRSVLGLAGPSVSAPMFDSAGNVWFLSSIELTFTSTFTTGLLRAVYDPATFSYELELVLTVGDIFPGLNSGRNWILTDLRLADSNSVDSATAWSGNIADDAFMGYDRSHFVPADPRTNGGLVLQGRALYDADNDGVFEDDCVNAGGLDEEYRVLLYIGSNRPSGYEYHGTACAGTGGFTPILTLDGYPTAGGTIDVSIEQALGGQPAALLLGLTKTTPIAYDPITPCFLNINVLPAPVIQLPPLPGAGPGNGSISFSAQIPAVGVPVGTTVQIQAVCGDPGVPAGFTSTRGVGLTTQL